LPFFSPLHRFHARRREVRAPQQPAVVRLLVRQSLDLVVLLVAEAARL
jgi:hypothetical protein